MQPQIVAYDGLDVKTLLTFSSGYTSDPRHQRLFQEINSPASETAATSYEKDLQETIRLSIQVESCFHCLSAIML